MAEALKYQLIKLLRPIAARGGACPTARALATRFAVKEAVINYNLGEAKAQGLIALESAGSRRRIRVDGCWTGWSERDGAPTRAACTAPADATAPLWQPDPAWSPCLSRGDALADLRRPPFVAAPGVDAVDLDRFAAWVAAAPAAAQLVYAVAPSLAGSRSGVAALARRLARARLVVLAASPTRPADAEGQGRTRRAFRYSATRTARAAGAAEIAALIKGRV